MNRHVNAISGRLSLRAPQRRSLEILDRITELVAPKKGADVAAALAAVRSEFPSVTDFERDFLSVCFALATGVGKTRLMGAFISYLHTAHGIRNFFVLAPNLTIYNKLITDFRPNTSKYVFKGIAEFATGAPDIITGDNYEAIAGTLLDQPDRCKVNIFNISKINSEVRGGKSPRIKRLSEYIGQSYFEYLAALEDLVLIMDESHRYRASAGVKAINELKPVMGLELTATPQVETPKKPIRFNNVIYDYPLGSAMADGFVKEPAVVTRKDFNPSGMSAEAIETLKLEDGVRLHESIKVELDTYARESGQASLKPFVLVIARETTHAGKLMDLIQSEKFFNGRYKAKVIQVDSSKSGAEEDEMVQRLLKVESPDEPTEIVIHVNMLKEGWDVTNLYTIVPLRPAHARTLIEQSIGRGLRLPYGKRTGVAAVDTLNIVAHDKFQEIVDEAGRPGSLIQMKVRVLDPGDLARRPVTVVSPSVLDTKLGIVPPQTTVDTTVAGSDVVRGFNNPREEAVAQVAHSVIRSLEDRPDLVPSVRYLQRDDVQAVVLRETRERLTPSQLELEGIKDGIDIAGIMVSTISFVVNQTIDIPRILLLPKGEVRSGFKAFTLDLTSLNYAPPGDDLWLQYLRDGRSVVVGLGPGGIDEQRLENFVVMGLIDFDDVSYDVNAEVLFDLAGQIVQHLLSYLSKDDAKKVLQFYLREIAKFVHAQMQPHYWEEAAAGYEVKVTQGFMELKESAYSSFVDEPTRDFRRSPADKSNMSRYLFGRFERCLYSIQKFQSDSERRFAVILDRETARWFKPAKGQFRIHYRQGSDLPEYQPDFVAETADAIWMLEVKMKSELDSPEVFAKKQAAETWCGYATDHAKTCGGKPWRYALIAHDVVTENMSLASLVGSATERTP
jgi:type III restriction enzyme